MQTKGFDLDEKEIARQYAEIALAPDEQKMPGYFYAYAARFVNPQPGQIIIDAGCGWGDLLEELFKICPEAKLTGMELSPNRSRIARQTHADRFQIRDHDLSQPWPIEPGSADVVVFTEVLEHLKQPDAVLREAKKALKPGGKLICTLPNATGYWPFILFEKWLVKNHYGKILVPYENPLRSAQPIDSEYHYSDWQNLFERNQLKISRIKGQEALPFFHDLFSRSFLKNFYKPAMGLQTRFSEWFNLPLLRRLCYRLFVELTPLK